jgi:hypothetical protein
MSEIALEFIFTDECLSDDTVTFRYEVGFNTPLEEIIKLWHGVVERLEASVHSGQIDLASLDYENNEAATDSQQDK